MISVTSAAPGLSRCFRALARAGIVGTEYSREIGGAQPGAPTSAVEDHIVDSYLKSGVGDRLRCVVPRVWKPTGMPPVRSLTSVAIRRTPRGSVHSGNRAGEMAD